MPPAKPIGVRSSLFSHSFPSFYACYLLKSIQTPSATSTYIGSTPSPPRRIRQHNGELAQGARKTRLKRPWVMQMIVHGFPSRLAALQFEWAWQHPHKSRHMRDGKTSIFGSHAHKTLQKNILIVRTMISRPPFNTWPLHVKLFTSEADRYWKYSTTNDIASPLPPGFTCTLELEGVDGKSGHVGSGRRGPISVNDEEFASTILAKDTAIAAAGNVECTICREPILNYATNPLSTALCPSSNCHSVSHLKCLSQDFISQQDQPTTMVPRGGHCKSCKQYILWGDVIRSCYRRMPPSEVANPLLDIDTDDMFVSDNVDIQGKRKSSSTKKKSVSATRRRKSSKEKEEQDLCPSSTSTKLANEIYDLSNLVTSSESEDIPGPVKRKPGRPRKSPAVLSPPPFRRLSSKGGSKQRQPANSLFTNEGEIFDLMASSEIEENATPTKRKPGRLRRDLTMLLSPGASVSSPQPLKVSRKSSKSISPAKPKFSSEGKGKQSSGSLSTSEGETFDCNNVIASSASEAICTPVKRKRGRPRKDVSFLSPSESTRPHTPVTKRPNMITPTNHRELSKGEGKQKRAFSTISLISSSEDETYDLNNLVAHSRYRDISSSTSTKRQREGDRKTLTVISPLKGKEQNVELGTVVSRPMSNTVKIKPGRSRKHTASLSPGVSSQIPSTEPHKSLEGKDVPALTRTFHGRYKAVKRGSPNSSSTESFDLEGIHNGDDSDESVIRNQNPGSNHRGVGAIVWPLQRKPSPQKLGIGTPDRDLHGLERAMSAISLAPRKETPFRHDKDQNKGHEVIEVSD